MARANEIVAFDPKWSRDAGCSVAPCRSKIVPIDPFGLLVKPVSLSGSRGVLRADGEAEVTAAVSEIRGILAETEAAEQAPILIEEYVPGRELSIDGLLADGALDRPS